MCDKYGNYIGEGYEEESTVTSSSYASTRSTTRARRKELDAAKRLDPGYNKIYRMAPKMVDGEIVKKKVSIELYATILTPGKKIRSALGGSYHSNYLVGKTDEHIFFKACLATGECQRDSNTFFFDTPEQYERVCHITLPQHIKKEWYDRFNDERKYRERLAGSETV
jgi:hypothetical protein